MVCPEDFEYRHPQDFLRAKSDKISPPWIRPRPDDPGVYLTSNILDTIYLSEDVDAVNIKTSSISDNVSFTENIVTTSQYYRNIPLAGTQTNGTLNGSVVNLLAINSSNTTYSNTSETFTFSESVSASIGFGRTASDGITISESVSTFKYISNPINQWAVNALFIG